MINNIQLLRLLASFLVIFYHNQFINIKIGSFGVDIFFVISGFIISIVVNRSSQYFLSKRLIRLLPMYSIFTLLFVLIAYLFPHQYNSNNISAESFIKSILFIPYHLNNSGPLLSIGWTLNYEMYFYFIISLFIFFSRNPHTILIGASFLLMTINLTSTICSNYFQSFHLNYYGNYMSLEFIYGIFLFYISRNKLLRKVITNINVVILLIIAMILVIIMTVLEKNEINSYRYVFFGLPSFMLVMLFVFQENHKSPNRILRGLIRLGNSSYIIYLLHPFILKGVYFILLGIIMNDYISIGAFLGAIFLIFSLSVWIHETIEVRILFYLNRILLDK
ncbi:acyltransferase family protein [Aquirufa lenticrescens]